ncbi:MAG: ACP S-malonyltransferase [Bdellovibrionales bacterium]|nr:ACP S-malonyltransferase [Bdellovibrionales bacterium]
MKAALFPGQGSQHIGMGQFLYNNFNTAKQLFEEASDAISLDFKKLCFEGDDKTLALTENTQPAIVLTSVCTWRVLNELGNPKISFTAGHSVGEYSAMVASDVISFHHSIKAVRKRGEFMQSAVPVGEGAMLAIMGLSPQQVDYICEKATHKSGAGPLEPANFNSPGQIVISGSAKTAEWLKNCSVEQLFAGYNGSEEIPKKIKMIPLKVSAPFHCSMMKPAKENMYPVLEDIPFAEASIPVVQNVLARAETQGSFLRNNLIEQITHSVRWTETIEYIAHQKVNEFVECGSGKVLAGLNKKINPDLVTFNINSLDELKNLENSLN